MIDTNRFGIECGCGTMMLRNSGGERDRWGCKSCGLEMLGAKVVPLKEE